MKQSVHETLSALMDGEADELELRRLLKSLPDNAEIRDQWRNWHLIRATLNHETHSNPSIDISARVNQALEQEELPQRSAFAGNRFGGGIGGGISRGIGTAIRYFGQSAIAASVALVVLYSAQQVTTSETSTVLEMADATDALPVFSGDFEPGEFTRMARFAGDVAEEDEAVDAERAALDRISRAVYRELDQTFPLQRPGNYVPNR